MGYQTEAAWPAGGSAHTHAATDDGMQAVSADDELGVDAFTGRTDHAPHSAALLHDRAHAKTLTDLRSALARKIKENWVKDQA
jgi:hypothetical protein